jgi:two-component system, NarL family, response regulator LiaR
MSKPVIRLVIIDDHIIARKGICALLAQVGDIEVVGEAHPGSEAMAMVGAVAPDVVLLGLLASSVEGIEAIRQIAGAIPQTPILAITHLNAGDNAFPILKAGAMGTFAKDAGPDELVAAIRRVHQGEPSLPPLLARQLLQELPLGKSGSKAVASALTGREQEVLVMLAKGMSDAEIAGKLGTTQVTVRSHVSNILGKLHLANRVQATLYALRQGITAL